MAGIRLARMIAFSLILSQSVSSIVLKPLEQLLTQAGRPSALAPRLGFRFWARGRCWLTACEGFASGKNSEKFRVTAVSCPRVEPAAWFRLKRPVVGRQVRQMANTIFRRRGCTGATDRSADCLTASGIEVRDRHGGGDERGRQG